jgi:hypothetical protein
MNNDELKALDEALDYLNEYSYNYYKYNSYNNTGGKFYVASINNINIGDSNISNRTYFYKNIEDCIYSFVERVCTNNSEPYSNNIIITNKSKLSKKVYIASIEAEDSRALGHGGYNCKSYEVDEILFTGTISQLIKEYDMRVQIISNIFQLDKNAEVYTQIYPIDNSLITKLNRTIKNSFNDISKEVSLRENKNINISQLYITYISFNDDLIRYNIEIKNSNWFCNVEYEINNSEYYISYND